MSERNRKQPRRDYGALAEYWRRMQLGNPEIVVNAPSDMPVADAAYRVVGDSTRMFTRGWDEQARQELAERTAGDFGALTEAAYGPGEIEGMFRRLGTGRGDWLDYIMGGVMAIPAIGPLASVGRRAGKALKVVR